MFYLNKNQEEIEPVISYVNLGSLYKKARVSDPPITYDGVDEIDSQLEQKIGIIEIPEGDNTSPREAVLFLLNKVFNLSHSISEYMVYRDETIYSFSLELEAENTNHLGKAIVTGKLRDLSQSVSCCDYDHRLSARIVS